MRNEVFDGVLPLRATGVPLSPARNLGVGGAGVPSPLFVLLKAVREVNPHTVRWVGAINNRAVKRGYLVRCLAV